MKQMLNAAITLAAKWHDGQYDKGGEPYICHVDKVSHYVKTDDEELRCVAWLHDVIEDTKCTYQDLRDAGMSQRVIDGVKALTKERGESYEEYQQKVFANKDAIRVKMADLRHNMDIRRLKGISTEKDVQRLVRYGKFYQDLKGLSDE